MFDAHLHLPPPRRWAAAREAGIRGGVLAGLGPADWQTLEEAAASGLTWSAGLHPWWVHAADDATLRDALRQLGQRLMSRGPVAIGECGLDFARARTSPARSRQHRALEAQLDMAREHEMPVVLHVVRATGAALGLVRDAALPRGGLVHGFAGPREVAMDWHRIGFCVGIGPAL
ncbi:MAG: TatD family hydrolase, partial [Myxococcota bacterium]|nr:TatD family hydrolase [Myxococcota bacterium]